MKLPSFILQTRLKESLPEDIQKIIDSISIDKKQPTKIVGSFQYIIHEYPGDIDGIEEFTGCCSINQSIRTIAKSIKTIALNVKNLKYSYLGDFKAGIDSRFYIETGDWILKDKHLELIKYDIKHIKNRLDMLYQSNLLSKQKYDYINSLVVYKPTFLQHKKIYDTIKDLYILRWSLNELLKGRKNLVDNMIISLEEALTKKTIVKIDLYSLVQNRFIEITNFYVLKSKTEDNRIVSLSVETQRWDYINKLKKDIIIYAQPSLKKLMKMSKRLWLKAIADKNNELLIKLYPLFSSGIAKLYQVLSDIETMMNMIEKLKNPPYRIMIRSLQEIKMRISTIRGDILSEKKALYIFTLIDDIKIETYTKDLDKLYDFINDIVNINTAKYLENKSINFKDYI